MYLKDTKNFLKLIKAFTKKNQSTINEKNI